MNAIMGFIMTFLGAFWAALMIATMYPRPEYDASWTRVIIAVIIAIWGGIGSHRKG